MNNRIVKEVLSDRSKLVCRAFLALLLGLIMSISPAVAEEPGAEEFNTGLYHLEMGLYRAAAEWFHYSAEKDNVDAQFHLGLMFQRGDGVIQSYKTAIDWYQKAIKQDDDRAMNNLGRLYEKGQGVTQSYQTAITWFRKAATHNNEIAMYHIGRFYEAGLGVEKNKSLAYAWYQQAWTRQYQRAGKRLDALKSTMTKQQIQQAKAINPLKE